MRIALLTHQFPGIRLGGIGVYTLHCARALTEAGHEAHIFTFTLSADVRASIPARVRVHEVMDVAERVAAGTLPAVLAAAIHAGGGGGYRLALASLLCDGVRRVHGETPFDIVEGPEYEALGLPLLLAPLTGVGGKVAVITHVHSGSALVHQGMKQLPADAGLLEALECAAMVGADACCAPSQQAAAGAEEWAADVEVLPLPFYGEAYAGAERWEGARDILYIGRLEVLKGAHVLAEAATVFLTHHPEARLRIAGPDTASTPDGSASMAAWMRARLDPAVASRVHFLGEQDRGQLTKELHRAAFLVVPSLAESYSYVCCEAMAASCPVIVSAGIGATEVVGEGGISFERGNSGALAKAMERLWNDGALRKQLAASALHRSTTVLSAVHTTQQRIQFYEKVRAAPRKTGERFATLPARYTGALLGAVSQMTAFLAGVPEETHPTPGMRLRWILREVAQGTGKPVEFVLYGAGRHTSRLLSEAHLWEVEGHRVISLIDDHPRFQQHPMHLGLPVESLAGFSGRVSLPNHAVIVLSTDAFQEQFWEQAGVLRAQGVRVFRLYE